MAAKIKTTNRCSRWSNCHKWHATSCISSLCQLAWPASSGLHGIRPITSLTPYNLFVCFIESQPYPSGMAQPHAQRDIADAGRFAMQCKQIRLASSQHWFVHCPIMDIIWPNDKKKHALQQIPAYGASLKPKNCHPTDYHGDYCWTSTPRMRFESLYQTNHQNNAGYKTDGGIHLIKSPDRQTGISRSHKRAKYRIGKK